MKKVLTMIIMLCVGLMFASGAEAGWREDAKITKVRASKLFVGPGLGTEMGWQIPWVNLGEAFVDGTGPVTASTTPNWTTFGNVSGITWDSSTEVAKIQFSGKYPSFCDGDSLTVNALIGSGAAAAAGLMSLDLQLWIDGNAVAYDAAAVAQDAVVSTNDSLDSSPELFTFDIDTTAIAALSPGVTLTIDLFNASTAPTQDLVLMGVNASCKSGL